MRGVGYMYLELDNVIALPHTVAWLSNYMANSLKTLNLHFNDLLAAGSMRNVRLIERTLGNGQGS